MALANGDPWQEIWRERRGLDQSVYSLAAFLPVEPPWTGSVPWPKVTTSFKVTSSMLLVLILETSSCRSFGIKNGNSSPDPNQVD